MTTINSIIQPSGHGCIINRRILSLVWKTLICRICKATLIVLLPDIILNTIFINCLSYKANGKVSLKWYKSRRIILETKVFISFF